MDIASNDDMQAIGQGKALESLFTKITTTELTHEKNVKADIERLRQQVLGIGDNINSKKLKSPLQEESEQNYMDAFSMEDGLAFMAYAVQAIAQDEFSKCFQSAKQKPFVPTWSSLTPKHLGDACIRYLYLFPLRLAILLSGTVLFFITLPLVILLRNQQLQEALFSWYCRVFLKSFGAKVKYYNSKPRFKNSGKSHVFVANHTSFVDYLILSAHQFPHSIVAQQHGGLMGLIQRWVLVLNGSLLFNRGAQSDRQLLACKMVAHVRASDRTPLLIFPEGTCVNNEYTVLFHKGAFEIEDIVICPVAIKYDKRGADPYWNTRVQTFTSHVFYLMTRRCLEVQVWFLDPVKRQPLESGIDFANRVKYDISRVSGLKNMNWNGYYKNVAPSLQKAQSLLTRPQAQYSRVLQRRHRHSLKQTESSSGKQAATMHDRVRNIRRSLSVSLADHERPSEKYLSGTTLPRLHETSLTVGTSIGALDDSSSMFEDFDLEDSSTRTRRASASRQPNTSPSFIPLVSLGTERLQKRTKASLQLGNPLDSERVRSMLSKKDSLVTTWKRYTKIRSRSSSITTDTAELSLAVKTTESRNSPFSTTMSQWQRRIENGSWRLWFKERLRHTSPLQSYFSPSTPHQRAGKHLQQSPTRKSPKVNPTKSSC